MPDLKLPPTATAILAGLNDFPRENAKLPNYTLPGIAQFEDTEELYPEVWFKERLSTYMARGSVQRKRPCFREKHRCFSGKMAFLSLIDSFPEGIPVKANALKEKEGPSCLKILAKSGMQSSPLLHLLSDFH